MLTQIGSSLAFRYACYALMLWLALWAESRPSTKLNDPLLNAVPFVEWVDHYNYWLWVVAYLPIALALAWKHLERFTKYMVTSGLVALARGVCIVVTALGPVRGDDLHLGLSLADRWNAFLGLIGLGFFNPDTGARVYLTKDLFFSGHTATTFLLLLYVWRWPVLRVWMLAAHVLVVASLFFAHLHYTVDVLGAYAVTGIIYAIREAKLTAGSR